MLPPITRRIGCRRWCSPGAMPSAWIS